MSLNKEQVKEIARLAKLSIDDSEIEQSTIELNNILSLMAELGEIETDHVEPMAHPLEMSQRLREDVVSEADLSEEFQAIAPKTGKKLTDKYIELDSREGIATIILDRPDKLNAWNTLMREQLREAVSNIVDDDDVRVLIITGSGRAFSAGEDVQGMGDLSNVGPKGFRRRVRMIHNVFDDLEQIEIPVIAAINGVAAGGGLELALSCDFRIASANAKFGLPEGNVGLIPGSGGISRLVKLVGPAISKKLVMTGEIIDASRALEVGLIEEVVEPDKLIDHCREFAQTLAARAPLALGTAKLVINQCLNTDLETGRNLERLGQSTLKLSDDHEEGVKSFLEKRVPKFTGK